VSEVSEAFVSGLGRPNPVVPSGLRLDGWKQGLWEELYGDIGAGFYQERFYFLFGEGVDRLSACLDAWSFLVPPAAGKRMILGRNAHGAILVLEGVGDADREHTCVLDPLTTSWVPHSQAMFVNLLGRWLPKAELLPTFHDRGLYQKWRLQSGEELGPDEILSIKVPLGLGGNMDLSNFLVEDIFHYYTTMAPIYANAKTQADAAVKDRKTAARPKSKSSSRSGKSSPKRRQR
jgi:hypothetical protein